MFTYFVMDAWCMLQDSQPSEWLLHIFPSQGLQKLKLTPGKKYKYIQRSHIFDFNNKIAIAFHIWVHTFVNLQTGISNWNVQACAHIDKWVRAKRTDHFQSQCNRLQTLKGVNTRPQGGELKKQVAILIYTPTGI